MKNNKNGKILNVLLGVIALFVIIFIISWIVSRGNKTNYNDVFQTNLQTMQEEAKKHFANELPKEIGDTTLISLDEMYDLDLVDELKYGDTSCDESLSYISITKVNATEYKVKSNLVCGSKADSVTEKIKSNTVIDDEDGNIIIDEDKDDVDLEVKPENNSGTSTDGKQEDTTVNCFGPVCTFNQIETTCQTTYEYEYVKRNVSCPKGYNYISGTCIKEIISSAEPTPNYTNEKVVIEDALVNKGSSYNRYTDPIITGGETTYYCKEGKLIDGKCYIYTNKLTNTTTSCPSGYTKDGNACYKYADLIKEGSSSCPSGYTPKNNACYKYTDLVTSSSTSYSCPNGYTKTGSGSNTKCLKVVNAVKKYTEWGNPSKTYSTSTKENTYTDTYEKKVLIGENTIGVTKVYTYAIYKRSSYYYCSQGTLSGTKCNIYSNPTTSTSTSTSCPSGYSKSGNTCYIKKDMIYSENSYCPSGYTQQGSSNICYIKKDLTVSTSKYCPSGYQDNGTNCYKTSNVSSSTTEKIYSCPNGYNSKGTGANIECFKTYYNDDTYYCENAKATLKGTKCYTKIDKEYIGSVCPNGYKKSGNTCTKTTTETTNPIWSNSEYIYSSNTSLEGYQKTGVAKFVTTCTRIEDKIYK